MMGRMRWDLPARLSLFAGAPKVGSHLRDIWVAIRRILLHRPGDHGIHNRRKTWPQIAQRPWLTAIHRFHQLHQISSSEWQLSCKHLVQDDSEREDVSALIDRFVSVLLGCGIAKSAKE